MANFEVKISRLFIQILDFIFSEICINSTQSVLSKLTSTSKHRWHCVTTIKKSLTMRLFKKCFFWRSPLSETPPPMLHFLYLFRPPSPLADNILFKWPRFYLDLLLVAVYQLLRDFIPKFNLVNFGNWNGFIIYIRLVR